MSLAIAGTAIATLMALAAPAVGVQAPGAGADSTNPPTTTGRTAAAGSGDSACRISGPEEEHWNIDSREYHRSVGTIKASMIFVDFPDHPAVAAEKDPAQGFGPSRVAFAQKWLAENSYGRASLDVKYDNQWLRMSKPAAAYHVGDDMTFDSQTSYLKEAVRLANKSGFEFGDHNLVYVVAAPTDGAIGSAAEWNGGSQDAFKADGGHTTIAWGATFGDGLRSTWDGPQGLAHETMHALGLPDLYWTGAPAPDYDGQFKFAGSWDIMSNDHPGLDLVTWHKRQLGWLQPGQWKCIGYGDSQTAVVTPDAAPDSGVKTLITPISSSAAYVAEVRTKVGYDGQMCDPDGGVLVYRVDADVASGDGPIRVKPAHPGSTDDCSALSFAPYDVGETFDDGNVRIEVLDQEGGGYKIRMTNELPARPTTSRLAGENRYATSAAVSRAVFPAGVTVAYVASGTDFPDALAGSALAGRQGGPVLLVARQSIPAPIADELRRLQPKRIVVLGGEMAVSAKVRRQLEQFTAGTVSREAGENRYGTAAELSADNYSAGVSDVVIASGESYPDALAGSPLAGKRGAPLLLVRGDKVPAATAAELQRLQPEKVTLLGGPTAISRQVEQALSRIAPVTRIGGEDRYATAVAIARAGFDDAASVFLATGRGFADALSGAPAALQSGGPILLSRPGCVPADVLDEIDDLGAQHVSLVGGKDVLRPAVGSLTACD